MNKKYSTHHNFDSHQCAYAVVLAGGSGSRLWPISRAQLPKQFLSLAGEYTMLDATVKRLDPYISPENVVVITNGDYANGEAYQALSPYHKLLEPVGRNTAPAIALAAAWLQKTNPDQDPIMLVLPADHVIQDVAAFHNALAFAFEEAAAGHLATFGIQPSHPDTGFGYIKAKASSSDAKSRLVELFAEKPNLQTAKSYVESGDYFWNSGMFVWKVSTILKEIKQHLPEVDTVLQKIIEAWEQGLEPQLAVDKYFPEMPDISVDCGILEKLPGSSAHLVVIPCDIEWSDVGSWDAVHSILPKDENQNAKLGNALAIDCKNSLLYGTQRLIAAVGVEDICVVETGDAILVTKRNHTQRVREVVDALKDVDAPEQVHHLTVKRPWGSYTVLEERPGFKMKRITVLPGGSLSLQRHQHRAEHWVVVSGTAAVTRGEEVHTLTRDQSIHIPPMAKHRLENNGDDIVEIIEVQIGDYLGEDDIERFEDIYGRAA